MSGGVVGNSPATPPLFVQLGTIVYSSSSVISDASPTKALCANRMYVFCITFPSFGKHITTLW